MKKLLIIVMYLLINSCMDLQTESNKCDQLIHLMPQYNIGTDKYVNALLDKSFDRIEVTDMRPYLNEIWYQIYYYDCKFGIKHILPKPYVSDSEKWEYGAIKRNGDNLMIDGGVLDLAKHKISESTLLRIKNMCINY